MSAMSEPPRELAALSVQELRAALGRQRAVNTELRTVLATQAELHQAELAARDGRIAQLRSQVAVLGDRVMGWSGRRAGTPPTPASRPAPTVPTPRSRASLPTGRCEPGRAAGPASSPARQAPPWPRWLTRPHDRVRPGDLYRMWVRPCRGAGVSRAHPTGVRGAPPPPRPIVTAYLVQARTCPLCGTTTIGQAPQGVGGRVQYGPGGLGACRQPHLRQPHPGGAGGWAASDLLGVRASVGFVAGWGGGRRAAGAVHAAGR